ncbi:uncharacterized protein [Henckelia pumila]|uniref:uncharacterized protein n=1 Tax=Henckelia pumila TaxID=405737 RepID=UPI003C6E9E3E
MRLRRNKQFNNLNDGRVYEEDTQSKSDNEVEQPPCANTIDAWINCIHGVGQTFKGSGEFRNYLKNFSVATRRSFMYVKNDSEKVIVICSEKSCGWRIYASKHKRDNLFAIRKCKLQHNCGENNLRSRGHPRADAYWIANVVKEKLRGEPSYRPCTMQMDLQRDFRVELEYRKVWKGNELAMHDIHGTDEGCYDRLRWYCDAVKNTNPGSVVECEIEPLTKKFRRLFICFHACVVGFVSGCRPLIFLDGTHIKNKYKGCILVAVSKDANDDLFTIAYAILDAENDANWDWFCYHLSRVLLYYQCILFDEFTFFSDRHPNIIKAVNQVFVESHHAYCLRHLVDNFVKQVLRSYPRHNKKHWSSVFKKAAYAPSFQEYEQHINNILESMPLARGFIINSDPQSWANALFVGNRWGVINNNIAECWNSWVRPARHLPIVAMVDHIRVQIMKMMHRRRESTLFMTKELSPRKEKSVVSAYMESRTLRVQRSCDWKFEVFDGEKSFAVDLVDMTCSCRVWQINKIPCKHAISAIETKSLSVYDFCDKYFKIESYRTAYKGHINPIPTFDISESCVAESDTIQAPSGQAITGSWFEHEIALEKAHTFEWKHCWIALGLRLLWNHLLSHFNLSWGHSWTMPSQLTNQISRCFTFRNDKC